MKKTLWRGLGCALVGSVCLFASAWAETLPDAGSLIRDITGGAQQIRPTTTLPPVVLPGDEKGQDSGIKVLVKGFRISRATLFSESELQALLADLIGKELTLAQLQAASLRISEFYRNRGYFARALLPKQVVQDGVVEIVVLESSLGGVSVVEPHPKRAKPEFAQKMALSRQKVGEPLRPDDVLHGLKVVNETPGYAVTASLQPGDREGETKLMVNLVDTPLLNGVVMLDNQGIKATGVGRLLGAMNLNNLTGYGDQLGLMGLASEGNGFARAAYTVGVGHSGLRVGVNATGLRYKLLGALSDLDAKGEARLYGVTLGYPLLRSGMMNLSVSAAVDDKRFKNQVRGIDTSDKSVRTASLGLAGDRLDTRWGGGISQFSLTLLAGKADLGRNQADLVFDQATAGTQGGFQKMTGNLSRLQKLSDRMGLFIGLSGQLAAGNLDSAEKFSLGGPNGVRAYPLGEGAGDQGFLLISELRYNLLDNLQLLGFVDTGLVQLYRDPWVGWGEVRGNPSNSYMLTGGGLGVNWIGPKNLVLRAMLAGKLGTNRGRDFNGNDSDGTSHHGRFWLQLAKPF